MKLLMMIGLFSCLVLVDLEAQSPSSKIFIFAGYPAAGLDYAKKISHQKWSSGALSVAISPDFYFRKYSFDLTTSTSEFVNYRILLPLTLRFDFYPNQILLPELGKKKMRAGIFFDAGYCLSLNLRSHLREIFFTQQNAAIPFFTFDGDVAAGSGKISLHPTFGFGFGISHIVFFIRTIVRPYPWKDLSKDWGLPEKKISYFYSWEYDQQGIMLCLGYTL